MGQAKTRAKAMQAAWGTRVTAVIHYRSLRSYRLLPYDVMQDGRRDAALSNARSAAQAEAVMPGIDHPDRNPHDRLPLLPSDFDHEVWSMAVMAPPGGVTSYCVDDDLRPVDVAPFAFRDIVPLAGHGLRVGVLDDDVHEVGICVETNRVIVKGAGPASLDFFKGKAMVFPDGTFFPVVQSLSVMACACVAAIGDLDLVQEEVMVLGRHLGGVASLAMELTYGNPGFAADLQVCADVLSNPTLVGAHMGAASQEKYARASLEMLKVAYDAISQSEGAKRISHAVQCTAAAFASDMSERSPRMWRSLEDLTADMRRRHDLPDLDGVRGLAEFAKGGTDGLPLVPKVKRFVEGGSEVETTRIPDSGGQSIGIWRHDGFDVVAHETPGVYRLGVIDRPGA